MLGHAPGYPRLRVWKLAEGVFLFGRGLGINLYEMFSIKSERLHTEWIFFTQSSSLNGRTDELEKADYIGTYLEASVARISFPFPVPSF